MEIVWNILKEKQGNGDANFFRNFDFNQQNDPHEFFIILLNKLNYEMNESGLFLGIIFFAIKIINYFKLTDFY